MSGSNAGTGQPLTLKCSRCKLLRNAFGSARGGKLVRTGRSKPARSRSHIRIGRMAYECECLECGHVGWYAHKQAEKMPLVMHHAGK